MKDLRPVYGKTTESDYALEKATLNSEQCHEVGGTVLMHESLLPSLQPKCGAEPQARLWHLLPATPCPSCLFWLMCPQSLMFSLNLFVWRRCPPLFSNL